MGTNEILIGIGVLGGAAALYFANGQKPLTKTIAPQIDDVVYVSSILGADAYKDVGDTNRTGYSYGRERIIKFPNKKHLGKATGRARNNMIEVKAVISDQEIIFWVKSDCVKLSPVNEEGLFDRLLEKTQLEKTTLLQHNV